MLQWKIAGLCLVGAVAILFSQMSPQQSQGQDKKTAEKKAADKKAPDKKAGAKEPEHKELSKEAKAVIAISAARQMAEYGREHKSPEALIAAAKVLGTSEFAQGKVAPESKVGKAEKVTGTEGLDEANKLLDEATKLAKTDHLKGVIAQVRDDLKEVKRGAIGGPRTFNGFFTGTPNDRMDTYYIRVYGGESTYVSVGGYNASQGGLDLDLSVVNSNGQVVASDSSVGPNGNVSFYAPYDGNYTIRVTNFNPNIACRYTLSHN